MPDRAATEITWKPFFFAGRGVSELMDSPEKWLERLEWMFGSLHISSHEMKQGTYDLRFSFVCEDGGIPGDPPCFRNDLPWAGHRINFGKWADRNGVNLRPDVREHDVRADEAGFFGSRSRLTCYTCGGATLVAQEGLPSDAFDMFKVAHPCTNIKRDVR